MFNIVGSPFSTKNWVAGYHPATLAPARRSRFPGTAWRHAGHHGRSLRGALPDAPNAAAGPEIPPADRRGVSTPHRGPARRLV
eukprot:scaffold46778_cov57-Phaeocystis_antarctica.AAC.4